MSEKVYFIISGQIHIMNKEGLYEYGILQDGSYFGDISLLLNEENDYSFQYFSSMRNKCAMFENVE